MARPMSSSAASHDDLRNRSSYLVREEVLARYRRALVVEPVADSVPLFLVIAAGASVRSARSRRCWSGTRTRRWCRSSTP